MFTSIQLAMSMALLISAPVSGDLWGLDDLRLVPFDTEVLSSSLESGVRVDEMYFTSEFAGGKPVRVYGFLARPEPLEERVPALLQLHGGGGTANRASAVNSARDLGMCILNIDWSGQPERGDHVSTAEGLAPELFGDPRFVTDDLKDFSARHTVRALVRSVSFLESREYVDPDRIGVVGGSWGGFLTLLTAGLDPRVKCAASGFGAGGFRGTYQLCARPVLGLDADQQDFWFSRVDPINYLDRINGPVALLTATNELHFWLNTAEVTYRRLPPGSRIIIAPNAVHTCSDGVIWPNAEWARLCLGEAPAWPEVLDFHFDGTRATWRVGHEVPLTKSTLYFSPGEDHWPSRIWIPVAAEADGEAFSAILPDWASGAEADAYPLVTDARKRSVSVPPVHVSGRSLAAVSAGRPDPGSIDDFTAGVFGWRLLFGNAALGRLTWREPREGARGALVVRAVRDDDTEIEVDTNLIYLARSVLGDEATLSMTVDTAGHASPLEVTLTENPGERDERVWSAKTKLDAARGWQQISLSLVAFSERDRKPRWSEVRKLSLKWVLPADGETAFADVRVTPAPATAP